MTCPIMNPDLLLPLSVASIDCAPPLGSEHDAQIESVDDVDAVHCLQVHMAFATDEDARADLITSARCENMEAGLAFQQCVLELIMSHGRTRIR